MSRTFLMTALLSFVAIQSASANVVVSKTFTGANNNTEFFDGSNANRTLPAFTQADFDMKGASSTNIVSVTVEVSFAKHLGTAFLASDAALPAASAGTDPFFSEIVISLQKVGAGTAVPLISAGSFQSGLFNNVASYRGEIIFDQNAATIVNANTMQLPVSGSTVRPVAPANNNLGKFVGLDGLGGWVLNIGDSVSSAGQNNREGLSFYSYRVEITAVPEPTSLGLLGMLVPCAFVRRRK